MLDLLYFKQVLLNFLHDGRFVVYFYVNWFFGELVLCRHFLSIFWYRLVDLDGWTFHPSSLAKESFIFQSLVVVYSGDMTAEVLIFVVSLLLHFFLSEFIGKQIVEFDVHEAATNWPVSSSL